MEYKASTQDWAGIDVVTHFKFVATMQLRTPFHVLDRHNETHWDRSSKPPIFFREPWQGIWVPQTSFSDRMALTSMMASEIGPVLTSGSDFHRFLLTIRWLAENTLGPSKRCAAIRAECDKDVWSEFVARLGGSRNVSDRFDGRVKKR
jgi:hypothetical protein